MLSDLAWACLRRRRSGAVFPGSARWCKSAAGLQYGGKNDPDFYVEHFQQQQAYGHSERFVEPLSRPLTSNYSRLEFAKLMTGKYRTTWKGVSLLKAPMDLAIYSKLLFDLKPRTIIDSGTAQGGSALWFADLVGALGLDCKVVTVDIADMREQAVIEHPGIEFWQGDLMQLDSALPPAKLARLPHPWLVVEDAHVNTHALMRHLHDTGLQTGDYLVIEDTHPYQPNDAGMGAHEYEKYGTGFGELKYEEVEKFLKEYGKEYLLDRGLCDMFGLNGTQAANAILKRV